MGKNLATNLATGLSTNLAANLAGTAEVPELVSLGPPVEWWRSDDGWDGTLWTGKVAGCVADGTGHAPTTTTLGAHTVLDFDGTQWLRLGADLFTALGTGDYSVFLAFAANPLATNDTLLTLWEDGNNYVWSTTNASGAITVRHKLAAVNEDEGSGNNLSAGFNTAGWSFDESEATSNMLFYIAGSLSSTNNMTHDTPSAMADGAIGVWNPTAPNLFFVGQIAEVILYDGLLTADDYADLHAYADARYG